MLDCVWRVRVKNFNQLSMKSYYHNEKVTMDASDNGDVHVQLSWFVNVSWCALEKCHFNENITQIPFGDRRSQLQMDPH